jgi:hypothetical protein
MKITKLQLITILLFLVIGFIVKPAEAQKQRRVQKLRNIPRLSWQKFHPPDKSFSVELPGKPYYTKNPDSGPNGVDDESLLDLFKCTKKVDFYILPITIISNTESNDFVIQVFDVSSCKRKPEVFDKEIAEHFLWMGGDSKEIMKDSSLKKYGRSWREIIYRKGEKNGGRFLAVDARSKIYLLSYETETMNDNLFTNKIINRIFKSFILNKETLSRKDIRRIKNKKAE